MMRGILGKAACVYPAYLLYAGAQRFLEDWRYHRLVRRNRLPIYRETPIQKLSNETAYMDMLRQLRDCCPWFPPVVYPVGGAASYGLLYILVRSLREQSFANVLELGVGQTTTLLSAYSRCSGTRILSLDENASWADALGRECSSELHRVRHAPLVQSTRKTPWYDLQAVREELPLGSVDLFLVDGPVGARRFSRAGILDVFFDLCADEWLVFWDDVHRAGDLESFVLFLDAARARKLDVKVGFCTGAKTVGVAFTPKYSSVGHYF
jgi:hypothetical protein